jgi:hypothetical protein
MTYVLKKGRFTALDQKSGANDGLGLKNYFGKT